VLLVKLTLKENNNKSFQVTGEHGRILDIRPSFFSA